MPNHVTNRLIITGPDARVLALRLAVASENGESPFDFTRIIPPPDCPAYREEPSQDVVRGDPLWWYTWNVRNWGTKWNAYSCSVRDDGSIVFDTAWSTPEPVIARLAEQFPDLSIQHRFIDEGWGFAGYRFYEGGEIQSETDVECVRGNDLFCDLCLDLTGFDPRAETR